MVDEATVGQLAQLSKIALDPSTVAATAERLNRVIESLEPLAALDLSDTEPLMSVVRHAGTVRADIPVAPFGREKTFQNAPAVEADHFVIPKVLP